MSRSKLRIGCTCVEKLAKRIKRKFGATAELVDDHIFTVMLNMRTFKGNPHYRTPCKITIRIPKVNKAGKPISGTRLSFMTPKFCPICGQEYKASVNSTKK